MSSSSDRKIWIAETSAATTVVSGADASSLVRRRLASGFHETNFECNNPAWGITVVTNGQRAMVCCTLSDSGEYRHLIDASATGESCGYILSNGQSDCYANRDTVELDVALDELARFIDGEKPRATWQVD